MLSGGWMGQEGSYCLVVLRFEAADDEESGQPGGGAGPAPQFRAAAREVLALLAVRPGFRSGRLARAYDQPTLWCLITEWESVGAYRRALGSYDVKAGATPLLSRALPDPSAFETLDSISP